MNNSEIRIFYSWQSDLPNNKTRGLIQEGIDDAVKLLRDTVEIVADRDTKGEYGAPDIVQTIFNKIDDCDIFIADVSIVNKYYSVKDDDTQGDVQSCPNSNVMLELGYAAGVIGWESIICFINTDYGDIEALPFDLAHHRLSPFSQKDKTKTDIKKYISNIIFDTVRNLMDNGIRIKSNFSNVVVGQYDFDNDAISNRLIPFDPIKFFNLKIKNEYYTTCSQLIQEINLIRLDPPVNKEMTDSSETPKSPMGSLFASINTLGETIKDISVSESDKQIILDFIDKHHEIEISNDFFSLGNLKERKSNLAFYGGTTFIGSDEEKRKYDKIIDLINCIMKLELMDYYSTTFEQYYLFPLAIKNISSNTDEEIDVSIIVNGSEAINPSSKIISQESMGSEGLIYELGIVKRFLLMKENSTIKYASDISYSIEDNIKAVGINGTHYDAEDYERELKKYIAVPKGENNNEYEFYIKSLRPKETCWIGPMIMLNKKPNDIIIRYTIKSNKSNGDLSGELRYSPNQLESTCSETSK